MEILQELEELKKLSEQSEEVVEETTEEVVEDVVEEDAPEDPAEEVAQEESAEETPAKEEPIDNAAMARMRRELAAERKRVKELEESRKAVEEPQAEAQSQDEAIWSEMVREKRINDAIKEFTALEEGFKQTVSDYDDVANEYRTQIYNSLKVQNPRKAHTELLEMTRNAVLLKASEYMNKGLDPIEEMYHDALELGFRPKPKQSPAPEVKPDMSKVAQNRARNAGMAAVSGAKASTVMTPDYAATLSPMEWSKLTAAERRALLGGAD